MKKFIISADLLKPALKKLGQAINEKSVLPILKNVLCRVGEGEVELIASDIEITIAYKCMAVTEPKADPFEILLPFDFLNKVVSFSKNTSVEIQHPSAKKAKIIIENDVYEINSLDEVKDFIKLPSVEEGNILDLDAAFVELLTAAMLTTGKDESRPAFIKTCLDILTEESYLVSTDAHFLFRHKLDIKCATPEQILFSHKVAKAIEGMDAISLCWSDKTICIKTENVTIWNSRFEDKYPNYKLIIPAYEPTLALVKADLEAALNKACISSNQTKQTTIILNKEDGMVHFETDDSEYSRKIHVKIPGKDSGNAATVSINAKKMLIMMDQFKSKNINLHIFSAEKAVLISTDEDADYLGLLMPLIANS